MDLNVDCFAIDDNIPINNIQTMQSKYVIQGNLDNTLLTLDHIDVPLQNNIHYILKNLWHRKNFIFNLNHGVLPNTQIQNIEKIIQIVREYEKL
jgi:uroporphyrinogen decarboxylase